MKGMRSLLATLLAVFLLFTVAVPALASVASTLQGTPKIPALDLAGIAPGDLNDRSPLFLSAENESLELPMPEPPPKGHEKLESQLDQLIHAEMQEKTSLSPQPSLKTEDGRVRVVIEVEPGNEGAVKDKVQALGGAFETSYKNQLQVLMPVPQIETLADDAYVKLISLPLKPVLSATGEGVAVINADSWKSAGFTGAGTKVGIIDGGFYDYSALLGSELPGSVTTWWALSIGGPGSEVHGTACAEIIYDIAPNAQFFLANCGTSVEFANAASWMVSQGVNVISCSIVWPASGPGNGSGTICDVVTSTRNAGVLWCQSSGNYAQKHWSGSWLDTDGDKLLDFSVGPVIDSQAITVNQTGEQIQVYLTWNDPWGASANNYDLYLYGPDLQQKDQSVNVQNGDDNPRESINYTALATGNYYIAVFRPGATSGTEFFHLLSINHDLYYKVASGSLTQPADSPDALTVGAVPWYVPWVLEPFSSQGPTTDNRIKPDLAAPDGVSSVAYGHSFFGTSAAAPHAAGAVLLVKQRYPSYSPSQLQSYLEGNAIGLGAAGKDNLYGSGMLNLPVPVIESTWYKTFGGANDDIGYSVCQTTDGGYIIAGDTKSYGAGDADVWLVKADSSGNEQWSKTFGGQYIDSARSVCQTSDGGYIIVGRTESSGAGAYDVWLIKTDSSGNKQWDKTFGGVTSNVGLSVHQTSEGGYIITGYTQPEGTVDLNVWLVKTDSSGNEQWNKTFGGANEDLGYSVCQTSEGGYIITGYTKSYGAGNADLWLIKTDSSGNEQWKKTFGGTANDYGYSVAQAQDSGYIVAGSTGSYGAGNDDAWLVKTDSSGNEQWKKTFGGINYDYGLSVCHAQDGGYVITGHTNSYSAGAYDIWLVKADSSGNQLLKKTFGGAADDYGYSVARTQDGGYIITGFTKSYGAGNADAWLIKVNMQVPNISVSPTSHDFGDIGVNSSSSPLAITISNSGSATLNVSGINLSDTTNYSLNVNGGSNPCGSTAPTIAAGSSGTVTVTFSPQSAGTSNAGLTVDSDDPDTPSVIVSLTGAGVNVPVISFTPASNTTITAGQTVTFVAHLDSGNPVADGDWKWDFDYHVGDTGVDATGMTPSAQSWGNVAGTYVVRLTATNADGSDVETRTITVLPAPIHHFAVTGTSSVTAGTPFDVTVTAKDQYENTVFSYMGIIHFTSTDGQAVLPDNYTFLAGDNGVKTFTGGVTLKTAGTRTVTATDTENGSITGTSSNITVNPAGASTFIVSSLTTQVTAGTASNVVLTVKDLYGNTVVNYTGTVHFTSTDSRAVLPSDYTFLVGDNGVKTFTNGVTLKTPGTHTVTATDTVNGAVTGTSGQVVVNLGPLDHIVVSPNPAFLQTSAEQLFTPAAYDQCNNPIPDLTYTWSVINGGGSVSEGGLFTAGGTTGTFSNTVQAEASSGGITKQGKATVAIGASMTVTATLQGDKRTEAGMNVPLVLKLYDQAVTTTNIYNANPALMLNPVATFRTADGNIAITNKNAESKVITFTVGGLPTNTYNVTLYTLHCLVNLKSSVAIAQGASIDMGMLLEGDAQDITEGSKTIDVDDFTRFASAFEAVPTSPNWDERADFDRNNQVTVLDFSSFYTNYGKTSPQTV